MLEVNASASKLPFTSLLCSKLFGFNFVIHFTPTMCYTSQAVSGHSLRLFTSLLYDCSLPFDLETFSTTSTHVMNICAKFHANSCTTCTCTYIDIASREIGVNGRTDGRTDGRTTRIHDALRLLLTDIKSRPVAMSCSLRANV